AGHRAPSSTMQLLQCILLCVQLSLALSGQDKPVAPEYPGVLHCGPQGFQFTTNLPSQEAGSPPVLIAWDNEGLLHRLQNDPDCGTWVREGTGSSVVLEASYSSCYVTEQDSHYIMLIGVEGTDAAGHKIVTKMKVLKCPMGPQDGPDADLCDSVPVWDRMSCAPLPITQGDCESLGCCYNSEENSCYYGNTVTSHCSQDGQFSIAVSQNVTSPPLLLNSVRLVFGNGSECNPVMTTHAFILFQFPFTSCGTVRQMTGGQAVYENQLVANRDVRMWTHGSITRDSIFRLRVSCSYSVRGNVLPANVQVFTLPPPHPDTQPGTLTLELQIAKDKNYSSYYTIDDYPVVKFLRDPIYVEVSILHRTDPFLALLLHHCWATPSTNHLYEPQWPILVNGCPYTGDNYQTQLIPVQDTTGLPFPSYYQRFSIFTFTFVDSKAKQALTGPVYLHCSVSLCRPAGTPSCMVTCPSGSRSGRNSDTHFQNDTASISSKGPMILLQASKDSSEKLHQYSSSPVDSQALWVAGLSGTLITGALLMSYLAIRKWK
uniref:Zona pellucida sperm-binding protein 4 n=1 Tax=Loxodonta africana TaxID=9785 RepID=G3STH1_LOXAF